MSEWTLETLKEHFDALRKDDQGAVAAALSAAERAAAKADSAMEKRFDAVNEFRATLSDQAAHLLPRAEFNAQFSGLLDRVGIISEQLNTLAAKTEGKREGIGGTGSTILSFIVGTAAVVAILLSTATYFRPPPAAPVIVAPVRAQ